MNTDELTIAVTSAAEETLDRYRPLLEEYIQSLCTINGQEEQPNPEAVEAIFNILQIIAAGTADTIVKSFAYALNID